MKLHSEIENKKIKAERPKDRLANLVRSFESEQGICICKNRAKLNVSDPSENLDYRDTEVIAFEQVPAGEPVRMLGGEGGCCKTHTLPNFKSSRRLSIPLAKINKILQTYHYVINTKLMLTMLSQQASSNVTLAHEGSSKPLRNALLMFFQAM